METLYAVAGAVLVATAYDANPKLGGAILLLLVFAMLASANRQGLLKA